MNLEFVNLAVYPIDRPDSPLYQSIVIRQRRALKTTGLINLPDFLTAKGIRQFKQEVDARMDDAFRAVDRRHPYGHVRSDAFPDDHPRNTFAGSEAFRLSRHQLLDSAIDALYGWEPMRRFIADITDNQDIHLSGDPSNALVVQVYKRDSRLAWHYDQALFSTIINLNEAEHGGVFECVPNLRTETTENYDSVQSVLAGQSTQIQKLKPKAGSFSVMLGRYTLHRVTAVESDVPKVSVVLSYELEPGVHMDAATRKRLFGPTAPDYP